jgi:uncharacterized pyridoxamine 5'-phosphate oxidase family protein
LPAVDLSSFIESHRRAFLVTRTGSGAPTAHPMTLIPYDGTIYFNTYRKSAKVRNIDRDPRMACLATSPDNGAWVAVQGLAEVVPAAQLPAGVLGGGSTEVMGDEDLARVRERLASGKRVYLRVSPSSVTAGEQPGDAPTPGTAAAHGPVAADWRDALQPSPIAMTDAEVDAFVRGHAAAALASIDTSGHPQVRLTRYVGGPADLVVGDDGAPGGPLCLTVDEFPTYNEIRGVMVHGQGRAVAGGVCVVPERIVSFDFRKIRAREAG